MLKAEPISYSTARRAFYSRLRKSLKAAASAYMVEITQKGARVRIRTENSEALEAIHSIGALREPFTVLPSLGTTWAGPNRVGRQRPRNDLEKSRRPVWRGQKWMSDLHPASSGFSAVSPGSSFFDVQLPRRIRGRVPAIDCLVHQHWIDCPVHQHCPGT